MTIDEIRKRYLRGLETCEIPRHSAREIIAYLEHGDMPKVFVMLLLVGKEVEAVGCADIENLIALRADDWRDYLRCYIPQECWGSEAAVAAWIHAGGLCGK